MFGNIMNRMLYGNSRKPDFKKDDLPANRFQLFINVVSIRFLNMIQLNLIYTVFFIPAFIWILINILSFPEAENMMDSYMQVFLVFMVPCLVIIGPPSAGLIYVLRNWARDEHAWVWSDFKDNAIKNWKESILIMLCNGAAMLVFYINISFYSRMVSSHIFYMISRSVVIVIGVLYAMMNIYIFPLLVTYKLTVRQILKNAFIFTIVQLPMSFLHLIILLGPILLSILFSLNPLWLFFYYITIGFSLTGLIIASYNNAVFDKYMNVKIEGVEVNKGLRKNS